ncbi:hypothetical protein TrST_g2083 [Triparma strigata]|uniref:NAD(P)-binding protein n=1 Tax=Triparma strigata TaxID=1606541 RepID=A0A9W7A7Q2_9STRA|nr:hypothetical protein TrST_g2083 [Triparma strigata]
MFSRYLLRFILLLIIVYETISSDISGVSASGEAQSGLWPPWPFNRGHTIPLRPLPRPPSPSPHSLTTSITSVTSSVAHGVFESFNPVRRTLQTVMGRVPAFYYPFIVSSVSATARPIILKSLTILGVGVGISNNLIVRNEIPAHLPLSGEVDELLKGSNLPPYLPPVSKPENASIISTNNYWEKTFQAWNIKRIHYRKLKEKQEYDNNLEKLKKGRWDARENMGKALVTGGGSGIGREISVRLLRAGYEIVYVGRKERGLKYEGEMYGRKVTFLKKDLKREWDGVDFRDIDLLVCNAGVGGGATLLDTEWEDEIGVNLRSVVGMTKRFLECKNSEEDRSAGKGRRGIIFVGSVTGKEGVVGGVVYGGCKSFLGSFSRSLAREIRRKGCYERLNGKDKPPFTITNVVPGAVDTGFRERIESGWCWKIPTYVVKARSVADVGIRGWAEGREEIVVGGWNKLYVGMGGIGGEAVKRFADRMWCNNFAKRDEEVQDASPPPLEVPTAENEEQEEGGGPELEEVEPGLIKDDGGAGTSDDENETLESGDLTL